MMLQSKLRRGAPPRRPMSISAFARSLGVTLRTLRFYEERGLISPVRVGSERLYTASDRNRMQQILKAKALGFSLGEIRALLDGQSGTGSTLR